MESIIPAAEHEANYMTLSLYEEAEEYRGETRDVFLSAADAIWNRVFHTTCDAIARARGIREQSWQVE